MRRNCSSDQEKLLKFEAEGREFLRSLEQFAQTLAEILTSNSVGAKLFFLGCNQDNNHGSNFIIKKKICLVHQKRKLATIEINKFHI